MKNMTPRALLLLAVLPLMAVLFLMQPSAAQQTPTLQTYALLSNANTSGPLTFPVGGNYQLSLGGTFGGATLTLTETQTLGAASVTLGTYTSAPAVPPCLSIPAGVTLQMTVAGGSPSGLNAMLGAVGSGGCAGTANATPSVAPTNVNPDSVVDAAVRSDSISSATVGASFSTVGYGALSFEVLANASNNTVVVEGSNDGGTTWTSVITKNAAVGASFGGTTNFNGAVGNTYVPTIVMPLMRWRISTYIGGTTTLATGFKRVTAPNAVDAFVANTPVVLGTAGSAAGTGIVSRPANTTTYTVNTAWANATSAASVGTISGGCRQNGGSVYVPDIFFLDNANQTLKLTGIMFLFSATPTAINDNATFNISSGDWANLVLTVPFSFGTVLNASAGASGAVSVDVPVNAQVKCGANANFSYLIEVTNAYVPISGEQLTPTFKSTALN